MSGSVSRAKRPHRYSEATERIFFNPWRDFCAVLPSMIDEAQDVRLEAMETAGRVRRPASWRGFYVGASVFAANRWDGSRQVYRDSAINSKPTEHSEGICAEKRLIDRMSKRTARKGQAVLEVIGIVVVGEPQKDETAGFQSETLWPCSERCWQKLIIPGKIASDALVVTVRPNKEKAQVQTVEELDTFYNALRQGTRLREPILFDHDAEEWRGVVNTFNDLVPQNLDPYANEETREFCVERARLAIQGAPVLRPV